MDKKGSTWHEYLCHNSVLREVRAGTEAETMEKCGLLTSSSLFQLSFLFKYIYGSPAYRWKHTQWLYTSTSTNSKGNTDMNFGQCDERN